MNPLPLLSAAGLQKASRKFSDDYFLSKIINTTGYAMRILVFFMILGCLARLHSEEMLVPDPYGLGPRLALLAFLRDEGVAIQPGATIEELREIYAQRAESERTSEGDALKRDRINRMRLVLRNEYEYFPSESLSEDQLVVLLDEKRRDRQARTSDSLESDARGAKTPGSLESIAAGSGGRPPSAKIDEDNLVVRYNPFTDLATVSTSISVTAIVNGDNSVSEALGAASFVGFGGDKGSKKKAYISVFSASEYWKHMRDHGVILLWDKERVLAKRVMYDPTIRDNGSVNELVLVEIDWELYRKWSSSDNARISVGGTEITNLGNFLSEARDLTNFILATEEVFQNLVWESIGKTHSSSNRASEVGVSVGPSFLRGLISEMPDLKFQIDAIKRLRSFYPDMSPKE